MGKFFELEFGRNMTRLEKNKKRCNLLRNRSNTKKEYKEKKKRTPKILAIVRLVGKINSLGVQGNLDEHKKCERAMNTI